MSAASVAAEGPPPGCEACGSGSSYRFLNAAPYAIRRCGRCGLRFLWPRPSALEVARLYQTEYFANPNSSSCGYADYLADAEHHRRTFRDRVRMLPRPVASARLLDVGAAAGFFVEQATAAGWTAEGLEPNLTMVHHARAVVGVNVRPGTLEDLGPSAGEYDVVTLWEVIEHLAEPRRALTRIRGLLRPGGILALSTPDAGSLVARISGRRWLGWRKIPEHLYFFDRASLTHLLVACGFEVLSARYGHLTVTAGFAVERLGQMLGATWLRLPARLGARPVRINPYYDLIVIARAV